MDGAPPGAESMQASKSMELAWLSAALKAPGAGLDDAGWRWKRLVEQWRKSESQRLQALLPGN